MNYHNITKDDMKNGEGIRVVLWVAGCEHHCVECHNPQTWDYNSGVPFDSEAFKEICDCLDKDYVSGITFSGGDPLAPNNVAEVTDIIKYVKINYPNKNVWIYTGYKFEDFVEGRLNMSGHQSEVIRVYCDVIVDGEYEKDLRDTSLKWRGSSNQRVIDVQKSLDEDRIVLYCD